MSHFIHFHTWVHNSSITFTLSLYPPVSHWYQHHNRTYFTLVFFIFVKRYFCLFKVALQEVFLWHFLVHMCYNSNGHVLYFSPFYYRLLLMMISRGLKIAYSFLYRQYITHIYILKFLPLFFLSY
jgi:hypothetical protein